MVTSALCQFCNADIMRGSGHRSWCPVRASWPTTAQFARMTHAEFAAFLESRGWRLILGAIDTWEGVNADSPD